MGKKLNTAIFIIAGTIVDILLIFASAVVLIALLYLCRNFIPQSVMPILLFVAIIASFIIAMFLYQRIAIWVIKKFNLEDKLHPIFKQRPRRKN